VPFLIGELGHFIEGRAELGLVAEQLHATAAGLENCAVVSAAGLGHKGDGVHFNAESLRHFGRRYASAWQTLACAGQWRFGCAPRLADAPRRLAFAAADAPAAAAWQQAARPQLFQLLMGRPIARTPGGGLAVLREEPGPSGCTLFEVEFPTDFDGNPSAPRGRGWLGVPADGRAAPGVLALPGHGGSARDAILGEGIYTYGPALLAQGYVVLAVEVDPHRMDSYAPAATLMGQRVWAGLCGLQQLAEHPLVDAAKGLGLVGLSLGGEVAMYIGALDERVVATVCSGWITTIANMKNGHCPCWNFPGLEDTFDFADVFALVAPRRLVLENGLEDPSFPTPVARDAHAAVARAYDVLGAVEQLSLVLHPGAHVFEGTLGYNAMAEVLL
jgi:dienelactone hydrolase